MDELWDAWQRDPTNENRTNLVCALVELVIEDVKKHWSFTRSVVMSEASVVILEQLQLSRDRKTVQELGVMVRKKLYRQIRNEDREYKRLKQLTERNRTDRITKWR